MPQLFSYSSIANTGRILFLIPLIFLSSCQSETDKGSSALRQDPEALAHLSQIDNSIRNTRAISPDQFAVLKTIREKYPNALEVRQIYKNALVIREDWVALERFFSEIPPTELTEEDRRTLGKVHVKSGKYEQAIETLKPLAETNPNDIETRSLIGLSHFYLDRPDEAAAQLDAVWDRIVSDKRVDEITARGIIYSHQNNLSKAIETLRTAIEIDPTSAAANNALSRVYARAGDAEQAEYYRARTVEINEKSAAETLRASRRVQQIYALETAWKARDYDQTISLAKQILPTTDEKAQKLVLYQYLFESYKALGDERQANEALTEAQKLQQQK